MSESIIVAIITGIFACFGTYLSNRKSASLIEYRLKQLEDKVNLHNSVIERTYALEKTSAVREEEIKVCQNRLKDLEQKVG